VQRSALQRAGRRPACGCRPAVCALQHLQRLQRAAAFSQEREGLAVVGVV